MQNEDLKDNELKGKDLVTPQGMAGMRAKKNQVVVGIGASAGGLDACRRMLRHIKNHNGCYVLCQHLSPDHDSKLSEILARDTKLKVRQISDGEPARAGFLFIAPPKANVEIRNDCFYLSAPKAGPYPKPDVNVFFASLAENSGEHAIAVILSGTGSDGAVGVSKIRGLGGVVLAQTPSSSDYDGMPNASIATHMVDFIDNPENLGHHITSIVGDGSAVPLPIPEEQKPIYESILSTVETETKINFKQYKRATIQRRLSRRMAIKGVSSLKNYLKFLNENPEEIWLFTQEAFIVVSDFYRDVSVFEKLKEHIGPRLQQDSAPKQLRIWVPGCATGDEAYTIAMLLESLKTQHQLLFDYKILATDISDQAITFARKARYPLSKLKKVPEGWLNKYFEFQGEDYEVRSFVREKVIFSVHNIVADPPFSNIDFISCRNLLIYFDSDLQAQIIELFHYSLNNKGLLLLGASENISSGMHFTQLEKTEQIYIKNSVSEAKVEIPAVRRQLSGSAFSHNVIKKKHDDIEKRVLKALSERFAPPCVVIDASNRMIFTHGDFTNLFSHNSGFLSNQLFDVILPKLKADCRALTFRSRRSGESCLSGRHKVSIRGKDEWIHLATSPLTEDLSDWVCISYVKAKENTTPELLLSSVVPGVDALEHELTVTRENLQTVIEELETANEQFLLFNEELQSSNEEYQSTNEELQTVNEELQSTNEELLTINEEYAIKAAEKSRLSMDLSNIQESLDIPFFLISTEFRIKRFTMSCANLIDINKIKLDDIFFAMQWYSDLPDLKTAVETVRENLKTTRIDVKIASRYYQCQVSPYFNAKHELDGYTIIFYDITDFEQSQVALNLEKSQAQTTLETITECVIRVNGDNKIEYANPAALKVLERELSDTLNQRIARRLRLFDESGGEFDIDEAIEQCLASHTTYSTTAQLLTLKTHFGKDTFVELSIAPLFLDDYVAGCVVAFRDVSERQAQLSRLKWQSQHDPLTGLVNRNEMDKRIERSILSAKRDDTEATLFYLDLDQFKVINDTCGHMAGDKLLKQLAHMMGEMLRSRDTLGRIGGDEFALLLDRCPIGDSMGIAEKIQKKIRDYRFVWSDKVFRVGVCIGIASINRESQEVSEVLSNADAACYAAKESGRNAIQVHSDDNELLEQQRSQMRSISDINDAIDKNRFRLYFQEIKNLHDSQLSSWEVLIRMFNKGGEFLLPGYFLPAAERFGMIKRIDLWVVENAIINISHFLGTDKPRQFPQININLSAHTIMDMGYLKALSKLLDRYEIPPEKIMFEITETAVMSNFAQASTFMKKAQEIGCRFSLDDFGTGMSSLAYLRELPIDTVKIDMSFIANVTDDPVKSAIIRSVSEVAHLLSLKVVAEGVETQEQLEHIRLLGVDAVQGYHLGKPMPFEEFVNFAS